MNAMKGNVLSKMMVLVIGLLLLGGFASMSIDAQSRMLHDTQKAKEFRESYYPNCDILLVRINWDDFGGFYYIPLEAQRRLFDKTGRRNYIKLPKPGTNPRGIEFTKEALSSLVGDTESRSIVVNWQRTEIDFNPYKRWIDLWREE